MFLLELFNGATSVALILYLWFHTDVVIEYAELFRVTRFLGLKNYQMIYDTNGDLHLTEHLAMHPNFVLRLLSCPVCFGFWLGLIWSASFLSLSWCLPLVFLSLSLYGLLNMLLR